MRAGGRRSFSASSTTSPGLTPSAVNCAKPVRSAASKRANSANGVSALEVAFATGRLRLGFAPRAGMTRGVLGAVLICAKIISK